MEIKIKILSILFMALWSGLELDLCSGLELSDLVYILYPYSISWLAFIWVAKTFQKIIKFSIMKNCYFFILKISSNCILIYKKAVTHISYQFLNNKIIFYNNQHEKNILKGDFYLNVNDHFKEFWSTKINLTKIW